jgi:hypothetical protein
MLVNMEKLIKNAERNLKDFNNNITIDIQHITDKYTELNETLLAIGFYTQDMDKESIQSSLVEFIKKEQTELYEKKLGEIFNG